MGFRPSGSMLRLSNTKILISPCGMLADRTRFVLYGSITIIIRKESYLWLTRMTKRINNAYDREDNAHFELHSMLQEDELKDAALLVLANKQDLPQAMSVNECTEKLGLNQL